MNAPSTLSDPVAGALASELELHRQNRSGALADYIPQLARVDPEGFGASLVSVHGVVHSAGEADHPFTIQSVSKPFVYALAATDVGVEEVANFVGFEPSGEPFNAISLDEVTGRPANPLINAGAIVTSALVTGSSTDERFERVRTFMSACAGHELSVDEEVFRSEMETGDRNRALAYLARSSNVLRRTVQDATEVYFRQCSILVTAEDLATMAATLANGGVNPITDHRVMSEDVATVTLSIMSTCGMYDRSGAWMARVGLPAKSGVGGGIAAVSSAMFGVGVYSPRLDHWGNSVRGSALLETLSDQFHLHVFDHPSHRRSPIETWTAEGDEVHLALRGELDLISAEEIVERLLEWDTAHPNGSTVRVDVNGVSRTRPIAAEMLRALGGELRRHDVHLVLDGSLD